MNVFRNCRCSKVFPNVTTSCTTNLTNDLNKFRSPNIHRSYMGQTYEGTGKTVGHIVNKKGVSGLCIEGITEKGFKLTNGWTVLGPTIFFPQTIISWNIKDINDISEKSLTLFTILNPRIDMLLLGIGRKEQISYEKTRELIGLFKKMKLNFEIMSTENAAATFNFCTLDNRFVSAALIPLEKISYHHGIDLIERSNLPDVKR